MFVPEGIVTGSVAHAAAVAGKSIRNAAARVATSVFAVERMRQSFSQPGVPGPGSARPPRSVPDGRGGSYVDSRCVRAALARGLCALGEKPRRRSGPFGGLPASFQRTEESGTAWWTIVGKEFRERTQQ
ncbi:hypothetical protein GCM10012320_14280 [Sinomonas cellulolyticus]|nr:hypothetical protein GCM10012320_14280 [Sinomonas sp. KCTC 49339]